MGRGQPLPPFFTPSEREGKERGIEMEGLYFYWNQQKYVKIPFQYTVRNDITVPNQVISSGRLSLNGEKPFILTQMKRTITITATGLEDNSGIRFLFLLRNSRGNQQYSSGGIGSTQDRVIDTAYFGNAQFPYVIDPFIYFEANATIQYEVEDIGGGAVPYTIRFAFDGYLLEKA